MKKINPAVFQSFMDLLFPRFCGGCDRSLRFYESYICLSCRLEMPQTQFYLDHENSLFLKLKTLFKLKHATALFLFEKEGAVAQMIHQFKYKKHQKLGVFLSKWLAGTLKESLFYRNLDGVVAVPLHSLKRKKRGYNQSEIIAKEISKTLKIPVLNHLLIRTKNTRALAQIGEDERLEEVEGAFELTTDLNGVSLHLLLVDDVITTGATLTACAKILFKNQTLKLSIAALACRL